MRYRLWVLLGLLGSVGIGTGCTGLKGESSSSGKDGSADDASMIISPVVPRGTAGSSGAGAGGTGGASGSTTDAAVDSGSVAQPGMDAGPDATMSEPPPDSGPPPEGCIPATYYADADGDDHGDPAVTMDACAQPDGYVANKDDCDDDCETCFPGNLEQCDNHDNDCDGNTDGQQEVCGSVEGICTQGTRVCTAGAWGVCEGAVLPAANETCEGSLDENCNGTTDEGCSCTAGMTRPCGEERGVCEPGTQACGSGSWSATCTGGVKPAGESCNGMDDDCNGVNDDPYTNLGGACSAGVGVCKRDGTYVCNGTKNGTTCSAVAGTRGSPVCGDALDNDCDGDSDEFALGGNCSVGTGACVRSGMVVCNTAKTGTTCSVSAGAPGAPRCGDNIDNDCDGDGDVDEFPNRGNACEAGVGACRRTGTYMCNGTGTATVCSASAGAAVTEVCANSVDDDCDNKTDEAPSASTCCTDAHCASTHRCNASRQCVPKTWCETRTRPTGVTASDYQCVDFDSSSSLPGTPWSAVSTGEGMPLAVTNGEAKSSPNSLFSHNFFNPSDARYIEWSAAAGTTARSVTFAADIRPRRIEGFYQPWAETEPCVCENSVSEVFCVVAGTRKHCLGYNVGEHIQTNGMVLISREDHTIPELFCDINPTPDQALWSRVELTLSTTGAPVVKINGTTRNTSGCTMTLSSSATSVRSTVGFANDFEGEGWSAHIDNVEISIRR